MFPAQAFESNLAADPSHERVCNPCVRVGGRGHLLVATPSDAASDGE
jgi:hypothetical protein